MLRISFRGLPMHISSRSSHASSPRICVVSLLEPQYTLRYSIILRVRYELLEDRYCCDAPYWL